MEMDDKPPCYMARPGEGLTPIDDPGVPSFYLPIEQRIRLPDDVDVVLDAIFYPGRIMPGPPGEVELRGYLMAEVPGYRAAFVVYAESVAEARRAAEHSADVLPYTNPNPSRTSDPG